MSNLVRGISRLARPALAVRSLATRAELIESGPKNVTWASFPSTDCDSGLNWSLAYVGITPSGKATRNPSVGKGKGKKGKTELRSASGNAVLSRAVALHLSSSSQLVVHDGTATINDKAVSVRIVSNNAGSADSLASALKLKATDVPANKFKPSSYLRGRSADMADLANSRNIRAINRAKDSGGVVDNSASVDSLLGMLPSSTRTLVQMELAEPGSTQSYVQGLPELVTQRAVASAYEFCLQEAIERGDVEGVSDLIVTFGSGVDGENASLQDVHRDRRALDMALENATPSTTPSGVRWPVLCASLATEYEAKAKAQLPQASDAVKFAQTAVADIKSKGVKAVMDDWAKHVPARDNGVRSYDVAILVAPEMEGNCTVVDGARGVISVAGNLDEAVLQKAMAECLSS
eukprot:Rmarinus@m.30062